MDLTTVINFVSDTPVPPGPGPTPGGDPTGGLSQTGDFMFLIVAMLLCVFGASVIFLRMWKAKKAIASGASHAKSSGFLGVGSAGKNGIIALSIIGAILAIVMSFAMVSANSSSALAKGNNSVSAATGPITPSKDAINAVVNEATGTVSIEEFYVTNANPTFFKFNKVTASLGEGIDDGSCDWKVYISNDITIDEGDLVYSGKASETGQDTQKDRYIASKGVAYVRIETTMDADTAKSLIGKEVLSLKLTYADQPTVVAQFLNGDGGTINHDNNASNIAVVPGAATYSIIGDKSEVVEVNDGAGNISHHTAVADTSAFYEFSEWTVTNSLTSATTITDTISFQPKFSLMKGKVNLDKNGGDTEISPASLEDDVYKSVTLPQYSGKREGSPATGWNTQADGNGKHYNFGDTFVIVSPTPVTLYADWNTPTFKAVENNTTHELTYYYNSIDYDTNANTVYTWEVSGSPKLSFEKVADWATGEFNNNRTTFKKVTIDESMQSLNLTSIICMFEGMSNIEAVDGLGNLNWSTIIQARYMFFDDKSIKEIVLPANFLNSVTDVDGDRELWTETPEEWRSKGVFRNASFSKLTLEGDLIIGNKPARYQILTENTCNYWLSNDSSRTPLHRMNAALKGEYTTPKYYWENQPNIVEVIAQDGYKEQKLYEDVKLTSGSNIPSWTSQIIVKGNSGNDFTIKATTRSSGLTQDFSYPYEVQYEGAYIPMDWNSSSWDFNLSYIVPQESYDLTIDLKEGELSSEDEFNLTNNAGWTKQDNKFVKTVAKGTKVQDILPVLPKNLTYGGNDKYDLNRNKNFGGWTNTDKSGDVIEDITFEPVWSYNVSVKCSFPNILNDWLGPNFNMKNAGLYVPDIVDSVYLPGFAVDIPASGPAILNINSNVAVAKLPSAGLDKGVEISAINTPGKSTCEFNHWVFIDKNGNQKVVSEEETITTNDECQLIAVFQPLGTSGVSNISIPTVDYTKVYEFPMNILSNVSINGDAPVGWVYDTSTYSYVRSQIVLPTTYMQVLNDWNSVSFSHATYGDLKLMGWYSWSLNMIVDLKTGGGNAVCYHQLIDPNSNLFAATDISQFKFGYDIDINSADNCEILDNASTVTIPVSDLGTKFACNSDGTLIIYNAAINKPGGEELSDDKDTWEEVKANGQNGVKVVGWTITTQNEHCTNETTNVNSGGSPQTIQGKKVTSVTPITSQETPTVTLDLNGATVVEGMVPANWTSSESGKYTKTYDSTAYTYASVLAEWNMEDKRFSIGNDKVFSSWQLDGSYSENDLIHDGSTIKPIWEDAVKVPINCIYPNFGVSDPYKFFTYSTSKQLSTMSYGYFDDFEADGVKVTFNDGTKQLIKFVNTTSAYIREVYLVVKDQNSIISKTALNRGAPETDVSNLEILRIDFLLEKSGAKWSFYGTDDQFASIKTSDQYYQINPQYQYFLFGYNTDNCATFYVDNDNKLHIDDPISGYSDVVSVDVNSGHRFKQWNYNDTKIEATQANPAKISLTAAEHRFYAETEEDQSDLLQSPVILNNKDNDGEQAGGVVPVEPSVEPQVDPVPSEEGEGDVPLAAAALAVPALAAFGFRKRIRGKHVKL